MKVWVTSLEKDPKPCDVLEEGERNAECAVENDCSKYHPRPCDHAEMRTLLTWVLSFNFVDNAFVLLFLYYFNSLSHAATSIKRLSVVIRSKIETLERCPPGNIVTILNI